MDYISNIGFEPEGCRPEGECQYLTYIWCHTRSHLLPGILMIICGCYAPTDRWVKLEQMISWSVYPSCCYRSAVWTVYHRFVSVTDTRLFNAVARWWDLGWCMVVSVEGFASFGHGSAWILCSYEQINSLVLPLFYLCCMKWVFMGVVGSS